MSDHGYRPQVEILSVTDTGRRRRWTDAEKVRIVEMSFGPRGSVAETARRHDVGRTLLVRWRRQYRNGVLAGLSQRVPTRAASDEWYRAFLPAATATFTTPTFAVSIEMVAGGLGTCLVRFSLLPNLSPTILQRLRLYRISGMNRWVVLAMRKHLQTHAAFAHIFHDLTAYCWGEYHEALHQDQIGSFDALHQSAVSDILYAAAE